MAKPSITELTEKRCIAKFGPPLRCPNCGHDVFERVTENIVKEELKVLYNEEYGITAHVVDTDYYGGAVDVECLECGETYEMDDLVPECEE